MPRNRQENEMPDTHSESSIVVFIMGQAAPPNHKSHDFVENHAQYHSWFGFIKWPLNETKTKPANGWQVLGKRNADPSTDLIKGVPIPEVTWNTTDIGQSIDQVW